MTQFDNNSDTAKFIKAKKKREEEKYNFDAEKTKTIGFSEVGEIYNDNIKVHGEQGHGFAAEIANTSIDRLQLKNAKIVGNDFSLNGADRQVNGVLIQTKYHQNAKATIDDCFKNGEFRYEGMKIEVPKGQKSEAWQYFKQKMGWSEQSDRNVDDYIIEGAITYNSALLISKPFHPLSIGSDALSGLTNPRMLAKTGITSIIAFAQNVWRGNSVKESFAASLSMALKNTGNAALLSAVGGQIAKVSGNALRELVKKGIDKVVKKISKRIAETLLENIQPIVGGIISAAAIITVQTTKDTIKLFRKHISVKQYFKNMAKTLLSSTAGTAGGVAGYIGGTYISGPAAPVFSEIGSVVGDITIGGGTDLLLDFLIEDDEMDMLRLFEEKFCHVSENYLLTEMEADEAVAEIGKKINQDFLKKMFRAKDREQYAEASIIPCVERIVKRRKMITALSDKQMEEMANEIVGNAIQLIEENNEWDNEVKVAKKNHYGEYVCPYCGAPISGLGYSLCNYCDSVAEINA